MKKVCETITNVDTVRKTLKLYTANLKPNSI